jgi:hypothetical protein
MIEVDERMRHELECRHCGWVTEGYSGDMLGQIERAKEHAKKHKIPWRYWAVQGKVIREMFKVITFQEDVV